MCAVWVQGLETTLGTLPLRLRPGGWRDEPLLHTVDVDLIFEIIVERLSLSFKPLYIFMNRESVACGTSN